MRAYDESYLNDAAESLGDMLDYVVGDCGQDADEFFSWFIESGVATQFERGNPRYVAGLSGVELAREVYHRTLGSYADVPPAQPLDRTSWYWAGWALAHYQWLRNLRFEDMAACGLVPSFVEGRYILHEADQSAFTAFADRLMEKAETSGKRMASRRRLRRLTQKELGEAAGLSLRMVQLYEQDRSDLSKAAAGTVVRLARVVGCTPEDLLGTAVGSGEEPRM